MDLQELFRENPTTHSYGALLVLFAAAWTLFFVCRVYILRIIRSFTKFLSNFWAQVFLDERLLAQLSWILPIVVIHVGSRNIDGLPPTLSIFIQRVALGTIVVLALRAITILLTDINDTYGKLEVSRNRPIKGFIQVALILVHLLALILIFSILLDRSPWVFLSGLGAMTAILLLVFRDTILSLVAGFQLTANNLICMGDWIEMPQFNADGDVIDIALHAVRVQNWDKTITVIPTHKFLEHSFKNWRGMHESGGRRIKRSIHVDMSTIRFLTESEIQHFGRFVLLKDYMSQKLEELKDHNQKFSHDKNLIPNARRLTNVGTFRAYITNYLRQHPQIHQSMTFLIRQLQPEANGLPIEIYVFTNDTRWAIYEGIQADIFDHILAIAPEFGLRVFQNPSGSDFRSAFESILAVSSGSREIESPVADSQAKRLPASGS